MKLKILCFTLLTIFVNPFVSEKVNSLFAQEASDKNAQKSDVYRSPFRYIIVSGETNLERYVNRNAGDFLIIEVLLDDKDFNENNLKILSELLSKRFSSAKVFTAYIYTSLEAIKTPEENDRTNLKGPVDEYFKYKRAEFSRNSFGNEWFEYWIPNLIDGKVIVLKGCHIKCK
jgi:hypothetical protein